MVGNVTAIDSLGDCVPGCLESISPLVPVCASHPTAACSLGANAPLRVLADLWHATGWWPHHLTAACYQGTSELQAELPPWHLATK